MHGFGGRYQRNSLSVCVCACVCVCMCVRVCVRVGQSLCVFVMRS